MNDTIGLIIRHGLTSGGGALLAAGLATPIQTQAMVDGATNIISSCFTSDPTVHLSTCLTSPNNISIIGGVLTVIVGVVLSYFQKKKAKAILAKAKV